MTLIKCPECQREISNSSKQCIHCGYPLSEKEVAALKLIIDSMKGRK